MVFLHGASDTWRSYGYIATEAVDGFSFARRFSKKYFQFAMVGALHLQPHLLMNLLEHVLP